jgi:NAD(P)-dependent dehydrogenase (short-subunit alcohol dehydrogenase family)
MSHEPFADRTVVLIGGGSGFGLATARLVIADGGYALH